MTELTDKTGAPVVITRAGHTFTVEVEGQSVGLAPFVERDGLRVFVHTEVEPAFEGRGLATVLIARALRRDSGRRTAHRRALSDGRRLPQEAP
jgi:uncharacterized protein